MQLFVYGSLIDDARVAALTGERFRRAPGLLRGYRKLPSPLGYPYIVVHPGGVVDGAVLHGVTPAALQAFDRYEEEGRLYRRVEVEVEIDGHRERAFTYVGIPAALCGSSGAGDCDQSRSCRAKRPE